jgi:hypothetical protein
VTKSGYIPARLRTRRAISIAVSWKDSTGILGGGILSSHLPNNSSMTSEVACQTAAFMPSLNAGPTILRWWCHSSPSVLTILLPNILKILKKAAGLGNFTLCRTISCVRVSTGQGDAQNANTFAASLSAMSNITVGVGSSERMARISQPTSWKTGRAFYNQYRERGYNSGPTSIVEPPRPIRSKGDELEPGEEAV